MFACTAMELHGPPESVTCVANRLRGTMVHVCWSCTGTPEKE